MKRSGFFLTFFAVGFLRPAQSGRNKFGDGTIAGGKLPPPVLTLIDALGGTPAVHNNGVSIRGNPSTETTGE